MSVLVVIADALEAAPLVRWGARFALARETTLTVLHVSRGSKEQVPVELAMEDEEDTQPVRVAVRAVVREQLVQRLTKRFEVAKTTQIRARLREAEAEREAEDQRRREAQALAGDAVDPLDAAKPTPEPPPSPPTDASELASTGDPSLDALRNRGFVTFFSVSHPDPAQACLDAIKANKARLLVVGKRERNEEAGDLGEALMQDAPCDTMLLRAQGVSGQRCERVLIPASGGPHAIVALRLAGGLSTYGSKIDPLYVVPEAGDEQENRDFGERQLQRSLREAGLSSTLIGFRPLIRPAKSPLAGISDAVGEGRYDLVLVGATQEGFVRRLLFGTVPDQLLAGPEGTAVAVVRAARPLRDRAVEFLDRLLERWVPQLERSDRIELFERLHEGSRFGFDFASLIALSTGIASLGLMQNSPAVVIGAMLVAPLMTPMIGAGLALVQGNTLLISEAARAIAKGFTLAIIIGVAMGLLGRVTELLPLRLTNELLARGAPNALDLVVAYLSGLAAAYALARPNLSGALPGVAIAAALVPPLGTVGICLAAGNTHVASGAALLFGTNLVAIVLGAATVFRGIGVHASRTQKADTWVGRAIVSLSLVLVGLLVWFVVQLPFWIPRSERELILTERVRSHLVVALKDEPATLLGIRALNHHELEAVVAWAGVDPPAGLDQRLTSIVSDLLDRPLKVRLLVFEVTPLGSGDESPERPADH